MAKVAKGRYTAQVDKPFVLFIIGMRVNSFLNIRQWLAVFFAMTGMVSSLAKSKESGLLHYQIFFYWRGVGLIQYWNSFEALDKFANDPKGLHQKARRKYYRKKRSSVGIWHETYLIEPSSFESVYVNMPIWGLGKAFRCVPVTEKTNTAALRMKQK